MPGTEVDIWSLDPDAGEFDIVGKGRVTDDGELIETIEGGVIAADWHGALPPAVGAGGGPGASGDGTGAPGGDGSGGGGPGDDGGGGPPGCPGDSNSSAGGFFGSQVLLADGAVVTSVATPAYVSGGRRRSLEFVYHSLTASPRVIIPLEATIPVRSAVPRRVSITAILGGLSGGEPVFYDTSTLSESRDETFSAGFAIDGRGLSSGFAPYSLRATSHFNRSFVSMDISDRAVIVNRSDSAIGAGWGIAGDQRIIRGSEDDSALLLVSGDGSYRLFRDGAAFSSFKIAGLGGERASDYSFVEGSFFSQARTAIADGFPEVSFESIETVGQASDAEVLVLSQYASSTEGAPLTVSEQSALTGFVRSGGCAIVFLDHDLGRASFVQARDSLLQPFGISGANTTEPGGEVRASGHPLMSSDFGIVSRVDLPFGGFEIDAASNEQLEVIVPGETAASSARIAVLPEGSLGAGSGPVIFVTDTQAFTDVATIGFDGDASHRALVLNAILYCLQANRDPSAVVEYVGPAGDFSRLSLLADGTFERRMPDGARYEFNASGRLIRAIERDGEATVLSYDGTGNLTRIADPFGRQTNLSYTGGQLSEAIDPAGRKTSFQHDADGNLVQVTLPDSATVRYEYDADHLMTAEINPVGGRTEREYDSFGRALSSTLPDGSMIQARSLQGLAADLGGTAGTEADPAPVKRPEELVASYTNAAGETDGVDIGPFGTASRVTDSAGRITESGRDPNGKPISITYPAGRQFAVGYDRQGRRTSLKDSATGSTLTFEYDAVSGAPTILDNGRGQRAVFEYDAANRPTAFTGFAGRKSIVSYAGTSSLPSSLTLPSGRVTDFQYDAVGNTIEISSEGSTTSVRYSQAGYVAGLTDAEGRDFAFQYDSAGNLTSSILPGGMTIGYTYDGRGLRTRVTTPSDNRFDFAYDGRGNLLSLASPLGNGLRLSYDYTGGQPTRLRWGDGSEVAYAYSNGNLSTITTSDGRTELNYSETTGLLNRIAFSANDQLDYTYDAHGRLSLSTWSGVVNGTVGRTYDDRGRVDSLEVNATTNLPITYDADDLVVGTGSMVVSRDPSSGSIVATTLGKCTDTWAYNARDELISYTARYDGESRYVLALTRDKLGRVVAKTETMGGATLRMEYVYAPSGRLVREVRGATTIDYTYDANGNRLTRSETGGIVEVGSYNAGDQVLSYAGTVYAYDGCGRLQMRGADTFTYGVLGGLQSAVLGGGTSLTYVHPAGGRRISESSGGVIQRQFLYQDGLRIVAELDGAGALRGVFGYATLSGAPDFMLSNGRTYRIFTDHLGSPRLVIDCESGVVAQMMRHDAFGRVLEDSAPRFQPFGFAGGIYDPDTRFVRFGARDYDPLTGRWTAPDPSLFNGSASNLYAYVSSDPVNFVDPNGREQSAASGSGCGGGSSFGAKCVADGGDVFSGPLASDALSKVGARAFTVDSNVFVGGDSGDGALYAHETVHQEGSGGKSGCGVADGPEEDAANAVEKLVLHRATGATP
ncbi:MAG: RHS repeat-associated core domain-containing protein [Verrucomicrobiales bacterium]